MNNIFTKFQQHIIKNNLISKKDKILVALSGGKDSIVLIDLLYKLSKIIDFEIGAIHINHNIREDSDIDQNFVFNLSKRYNINCYCESIDRKIDQNVEAKARVLRYKIFDKILKKYSWDKLATAHTKSDQIETFFIRLYRGSSVDGLIGIYSKRKYIIRPLLPFTTAEIYQYINENGLKYVEDYTNKETKYLRNKIRHNILPNIEIDGYNIENHIVNLTKQVEVDRGYFLDIIKNIIKNYIFNLGDSYFIDQKFLIEQHQSIKFRFINNIALKYLKTLLSTVEIKNIDQFITQKKGKLEIKKGIFLYCDRGWIALKFENKNILSVDNLEKMVDILKKHGFWGFKNCQYSDLVIKEDPNYTLSTFKEGDKMVTYNGSLKKVKDIFIDHKIPSFLKNCWPIIKYKGEIISILNVEKGGFYKKS